jgi:hypothetical protein
VNDFSYGLAIVQEKRSGKYAVITRKCDTILESDAFPTITGNGCIITKTADTKGNTCYALFDSLGNRLTDSCYSRINWFSYGLASVNTAQGWGYIDEHGDIKINTQFREANDFDGNGLAKVKKQNSFNYTMIDKNGTDVLNDEYEQIGNNYPYYKVKKSGLWGVIGADGIEIIKPQISDKNGITYFNSYFLVNDDGKRWFYDTIGNCIPNGKKYDYAKPFRNGYAAVKKGDLWGFIDTTGQEVIKPQYDFISDFGNDGKAWVGYDRYYFYIDNKGKYTIK